MNIEMKEVESSNIAKIGYDNATETLYVKFKGSGLYSYAGVPEEDFQFLLEAEAAGESVGKRFATRIRKNPNYVGVRVTEDVEETA